MAVIYIYIYTYMYRYASMLYVSGVRSPLIPDPPPPPEGGASRAENRAKMCLTPLTGGCLILRMSTRWTVGQRVAITNRYVPEGGFPRGVVAKVYKTGGCSLEDGSRWNASGGRYGSERWSWPRLRAVEEIETWEAEVMHKRCVETLQREIANRVRSVRAIGVLTRALAVLKGEG